MKKCQREIRKMQGIKNVLIVLTGTLAYGHKNMNVYLISWPTRRTFFPKYVI